MLKAVVVYLSVQPLNYLSVFFLLSAVETLQTADLVGWPPVFFRASLAFHSVYKLRLLLENYFMSTENILTCKELWYGMSPVKKKRRHLTLIWQIPHLVTWLKDIYVNPPDNSMTLNWMNNYFLTLYVFTSWYLINGYVTTQIFVVLCGVYGAHTKMNFAHLH